MSCGDGIFPSFSVSRFFEIVRVSYILAETNSTILGSVVGARERLPRTVRMAKVLPCVRAMRHDHSLFPAAWSGSCFLRFGHMLMCVTLAR